LKKGKEKKPKKMKPLGVEVRGELNVTTRKGAVGWELAGMGDPPAIENRKVNLY